MSSDLYRVAIVGASSLKGKELKEVLEARNFPAGEIKLLDDEAEGQLDSVGDEPTFVQTARPEHFQEADVAFFAGDAALTAKHWEEATRAGCTAVDMSYAMEGKSRIRAPWVERELATVAPQDMQASSAIAAHPASVTVALILARAKKAAAVRHASVVIFEPASERGKAGMDELHQQTVSLLSFQTLPKAVFDAQVAFNLQGRLGAEAKQPLDAVEKRIVSHFRHIAGDEIPLPSLMLVQAPTFHAHVFSIYIELEKTVADGDFVKAVQGDHIIVVRTADLEDTPSNVGAAGRDEIMLTVKRDPAHENGFWIWGAEDNLRIQALTAVDCAAVLVANRAQGRVQ
jgi:aspartate-semialdehyde dehydrogenase